MFLPARTIGPREKWDETKKIIGGGGGEERRKGKDHRGSKTQVTGDCFTDTVTTLTPFLMLTLRLSATLRQCFRPKHYTETMFRPKISISKGLGCSGIDKRMTPDLRFRPATRRL